MIAVQVEYEDMGTRVSNLDSQSLNIVETPKKVHRMTSKDGLGILAPNLLFLKEKWVCVVLNGT